MFNANPNVGVFNPLEAKVKKIKFINI